MHPTAIRSLIVPFLIMLSGCSFKQASYHTLHNIAKQDCRNIPNPEERVACQARHNESYNTYKTKTSEGTSTY